MAAPPPPAATTTTAAATAIAAANEMLERARAHYSAMLRDVLRGIAKSYGVASSGLKADLVERMAVHLVIRIRNGWHLHVADQMFRP